MKLQIALVVLLGLATSMSAQTDVPRTGETLRGGAEALKKFESGETRFPPRPKDMWEVGVHGGHLFYAGDINAQPGYGFGLHLRKSLGYVLSARLDLMAGVAKGVNYKPFAPLQISQNSVLSKAVVKNAAGAVTDRLTNHPFYVKYRSEYYQAGIEGIINIGNLLFHQQQNKWNVYGLTGMGIQVYKTSYDMREGSTQNGAFYTYTNLPSKSADLNTFAGRDQRIKDVLGAGTQDVADYETPAEKRVSTVDLFERGTDLDKFTSNIYVPLGLGLSYRLSKRVNFSLEHKVMFSDDDLLDGQQWAAQGGFTPNRDNAHYSSARLAFNIGNFAKQEEPLYWQNPLDQPMAQLQKNRAHDPADMLKDDDNDGVINMLDKEEKTPEGAPVDTRGRALDSDADGVKDYMDDEPHTMPKSVVNERGVGAVKPFDCSTCGSNWFLPSVHFDNDKFCIKGEYYSDLKNVANVLAKNPKVCIAVTGFTDDGRTGDYNQGLAYNRAKAVADFLVANYGVDKNRVAIKIGGEDNMAKTAAASNFANRRVEIETVACGTASAAAPASAATSGSASCTPTYTPPVGSSVPPVYIPTPEPAKTIRINSGVPKR